MRGWLAIFAAMTLLAAAEAGAADAVWAGDAALIAAARQEGSAVLFSSNNEEEVLPQLARFEQATGIKIDYVRSTDTALLARIQLEARAGKQSWDVLNTPAVELLPKEWLLAYAPPEAAGLLAQAKDPENRWFGTHAILHVPAYNTGKVKAADLPRAYGDFAKHPEWDGHVGIDFTDRDWLSALVGFHGEGAGKSLVQSIVGAVHPSLYKGHLALARALGSGEYWLNLNNYANLVLNAQLAGDPVDFFVLDPVVATYGEAGLNARAPHANAGKLLLDFLVSAEAQTMRTKWGRIPTRADVATNPPGLMDRFKDKTIVRASLTAEQDQRWQKTFNEWFGAK
jgi:ABC-type Fe3+ transport system substrate-binding protein